jgi:hypothetical protein
MDHYNLRKDEQHILKLLSLRKKKISLSKDVVDLVVQFLKQ